MATYEFNAAYKRILQIFEVKTQDMLASRLGIKQSSISDAKCRGRIPDGWLLSAVIQRAANPLWILQGEGAQYLMGTDNEPFMVVAGKNFACFSTEELINELALRLPNCIINVEKKNM